MQLATQQSPTIAHIYGEVHDTLIQDHELVLLPSMVYSRRYESREPLCEKVGESPVHHDVVSPVPEDIWTG